MPKALVVHTTLTPDQLSDAARTAADPRLAQRILAIRHVLLGHSCNATAQIFGYTASPVHDWVHRFNAEGLDGLVDKPRSGRPPFLSADQEEAFKARIRAAPPEGRATWNANTIQALLKNEFSAEYTESGTYFLLHRVGMEWLVPRPRHPASDLVAQEAFKKTSPRC
jgi:transposase